MTNYQLEVIAEPEPGTRAVFTISGNRKFAFIKGVGKDNYLCGSCQNIICENVNRGQISNIVFKCPYCESFNELKGTYLFSSSLNVC